MGNSVGYDTLNKLRHADWDRLSLILAGYAVNKTRRLFWKSGTYEQLARGETAESLVTLAVEKVLSGERRWDVARYPDLETFLKSIMDSLINHLAMSVDNRELERLPEDPEARDALLRKAASAAPGSHLRDPETALFEKESARREAEMVAKVKALISDDPDLVKVWDCLWNSVNKPQDIAQETGLSIEQVYQLRRKLKRRLEELRSEIKSSSKRP
jgi:hypothetical protein